MIPKANFTPTGDGDLRKRVEPTADSGQRPTPTALPVDDRQEKKPFRKVLDQKLSEKDDKKAKAVVGGDEEGEETSLFDIASQTPVKKVVPLKDTLSEEGDTGEDALIASAEKGTVPVLPTSTKPRAEITPEQALPTPVELPKQKVVLPNIDLPLVPKQKVVSEKGKTTIADTKVEKMASKPMAKAEQPLEEGIKPIDTVKKPVGMIAQSDTTEELPVPLDTDLKPVETVKKPVVTVVDIPLDKAVDKVEAKPKEKVKEKAVLPADIEQAIKPETIVPQVTLAPVTAPPLEAPLAKAISNVPEQAAKAREVLIKLASEMIDRLQTITTPDKVDTTFTLQTPLFKGVEVTVTEYTNAQKQFNITFGGELTVDARNLIAMTDNQQALRQALLEKGYTLQMITIEQKIPGLDALGAGGVESQQDRSRGRGETGGGRGGAEAGEEELTR